MTILVFWQRDSQNTRAFSPLFSLLSPAFPSLPRLSPTHSFIPPFPFQSTSSSLPLSFFSSNNCLFLFALLPLIFVSPFLHFFRPRPSFYYPFTLFRSPPPSLPSLPLHLLSYFPPPIFSSPYFSHSPSLLTPFTPSPFHLSFSSSPSPFLPPPPLTKEISGRRLLDFYGLTRQFRRRYGSGRADHGTEKTFG